ncbi:MAG TPA: hypothetical protein DEP87_03405 [Candidatus Pacebacteria bacterium]|nr:hypothetical protein [Candidatus Paceibacterota bacterium]
MLDQNQSKTAVITTGLNGLIGSKLATDFGMTYDFTNLDITHPTQPTDITQYDQVATRLEALPAASQVIHFAAYTDVTGAWNQRENKTGLAYQVNVEGTKNLIKACQATGKSLIHISTAFVFNGENAQSYVESDPVSPIEWYGQTKAWAEAAVQTAEIPWTILRIDMPFRSEAFPKLDFAHKIIKGMVTGELHPQFTDHYVGPTFIDDFVKVIDFMLRTHTTGLFHASSGEKWSDFEFAKMLNLALKLNFEVKPGDLTSYLASLERPYQKNTSLNCERLKKILDFELKTVEQAVSEIKQPWLIN